MNVATMSPEELRTDAMQRCQHAHVDRHWSLLAPLLRRVDREQLYSIFGFPSLQAYAEDELGLGGYELVRLLQLAELMAGTGQVTAEQWRKLPLSKAQEVHRIVSLGGSPYHWVSIALASPTTDTLRVAIAKHLDPVNGLKETFVRKTLRMPATSLALFEAGLELALEEALGQADVPRERIHHPDVTFRCVDVIVAHYVATMAQGATANVE